MHLAAPFSTEHPTLPGQRPRDDELDLFGMTHVGKVRAENEDHFLLCTVHPQVVIHGTSLPEPDKLSLRGQRLATILLVADGVGGRAAGARASRIATEAVTRYVASALRSYHAPGSTSEVSACVPATAPIRPKKPQLPTSRWMSQSGMTRSCFCIRSKPAPPTVLMVSKSPSLRDCLKKL